MKTLSHIYYILFAGMALLGTACTQPTSIELVVPSDPRSVQLAVLDWLECEECLGKEKTFVVEQLGSLALPLLDSALLQGPSPARQRQYQVGLNKSYENLILSLNNSLADNPADSTIVFDDQNFSRFPSRREFLQTYQRRYVDRYQSRAFEALVAIEEKQAADQAAAEEAIQGFLALLDRLTNEERDSRFGFNVQRQAQVYSGQGPN